MLRPLKAWAPLVYQLREFHVAQRTVLVPGETNRIPGDHVALNTLAKCFPGRTVSASDFINVADSVSSPLHRNDDGWAERMAMSSDRR